MYQRGTVTTGRTSNTDVDDDERQALRNEGLDPDNPGTAGQSAMRTPQHRIGGIARSYGRRAQPHRWLHMERIKR
jgi:hypothetical protein